MAEGEESVTEFCYGYGIMVFGKPATTISFTAETLN
jgi:hypothetical protein